MPRKVNKKCQACAVLSAEEAIAVHGATGDNCWNPENIHGWGYDCHRRRSHYRHRSDNNAIRRRLRRHAAQVQGEELGVSESQLSSELCPGAEVLQSPIPIEPSLISAPTIAVAPAAVLVLYRQGKDTPVHAIAAEVWRGSDQLATVEAVHCMGMRGDKVTAYIRDLLASLHERFGVSKFEDVVKELPVHQCPIQNCPLKG